MVAVTLPIPNGDFETAGVGGPSDPANWQGYGRIIAPEDSVALAKAPERSAAAARSGGFGLDMAPLQSDIRAQWDMEYSLVPDTFAPLIPPQTSFDQFDDGRASTTSSMVATGGPFGGNFLDLNSVSARSRIGRGTPTGYPLGAGPFTVEMFVRVPNPFDTSNVATFLTQYRSNGNQRGWRFFYDPRFGALPGLLVFTYSNNGVSFTNVTVDWQPTANVWHHIAADYDGTTLRLYADGVLISTTVQAINVFNTPTEDAFIGTNFNGSGFIPTIPFDAGQLRITIGDNVRPGPYTVPTTLMALDPDLHTVTSDEIDLLQQGIDEAQIDAGSLSATLSAWARNAGTGDPTAGLRIQWLDLAGDVISESTEALLETTTTFQQMLTPQPTIPAGARTARILARGEFLTTVQWDDFEFIVDGVTIQRPRRWHGQTRVLLTLGPSEV